MNMKFSPPQMILSGRSIYHARPIVAPVPSSNRRMKNAPVVHASQALPPCSRGKGGRIFIFGLGYTSLGFANQFLKDCSWSVAGTCRDPEKREILGMRGIKAFDFDPDNDQGLPDEAIDFLQGTSYILSSVPPVGDFDRDPVLQLHSQLLVEIPRPPLQWVGYLSSTSVYGDHQGAWVDESSACFADDGKGRHRIAAEQAWLRLFQEHGLPVHVFRLGGIYGPRRNALETAKKKQLQGGVEGATQQRRAQQRFTSRTHVADIVHVLRASMDRPTPGETFNVCDDEPAPRSEVNDYVTRLIEGRAAAPGTAVSTSSRESGSDSKDAKGPGPAAARAPSGPSSISLPEKRVSNRKIKEVLGVQLRYPTYREGLKAIHEGSLDPFQV